MISSRNKIAAVLLGSVALTHVMFLGQATAQEKPRSLVPNFVESQLGQNLDTDKAPSDQLTRPSTAAPITETAPVPQEQSSGAFQVQSLGALHPATINLLASDEGALGLDLWGGVSGNLVVELMSRVHANGNSPTLTDLYRRLVLSGANVPDRAQIADQLMELRLQKIIDQGWFDKANSFLSRIPSNMATDNSHKLEAQLMLLDGRSAEVCKDGGISAQYPGVSPFWAKLETYCQLRKGSFDKAELNAALLEERNEDDPLFFALVAALVGSPINFDERREKADAIHYAMLKQRDAAYPAELVQAASQSVKTAILTEPDRVKSGIIGLALDNIRAGNAVDLDALLAGPQTSSPQNTDPASGAADYTPLLQAVISKDLTDLDRVEYLKSLWQMAKEAGDFFAVTKLTLPQLEKLPIGDYGQDFNRQAVGLLLLNDRLDLARQWERAARRAAIQGTPEERLRARGDITRLDMYMLLSGAEGIARWNPASFNSWLGVMAEDLAVADKASFLLTVFEVFGYSVTIADWDRLLYLDQSENQNRNNHAYENILVNSAVQKLKGKTVALGLLAMGVGQADDVSLTTLRAVTSALKAVGLEKSARKLALEVAILKDL